MGRKKLINKKQSLQIYLLQKDIDKLQEMADFQDLPLSEFVRNIIKNFINKEV